MRILYITASFPFGPGEEFLAAEVTELVRQGHEVLIAPRSPRCGPVGRDAAGMLRLTAQQPLLVLAGYGCGNT